MNELIVTGHTVEEAVALACEQLGLRADDITYEVLELPAKKLFGQSPAKVKVFYEQAGVVERPAEPEPVEDYRPAPVREHRNERRPEKRDERPAEKRSYSKPVEPAVPDVEISESELPESAVSNVAYLKSMVEKLVSAPVIYKYFKTETGVKVALDGDDSAILIGRRGETMEALQYLCSLTNSRGEKNYVKVTLDVAGYREKREAALISMANRIGGKVQKSHRSQTLQPMNPYERRIVHSAIQHISGVKSESIGEEPNRRIVISPEGRSRNGGGHTERNGGRHSNPAPRRDERPADTGAAPAVEAPAKTETQPGALYAKIEI